MTQNNENRLKNSASAYLRSAAHQPIDWNEWGEQAFAKARAEEKPILLDIGAVWCHWCHVMDRESYEDPEIAVVAFVYNGMEGSTVAGPIVRRVLEAYFDLKSADSTVNP